MSKLGLVLSGGGARGAYQVGVLKALINIANNCSLAQPFPIMTGVSAGALNTSYLAANADNLQSAIEKLESFWTTLRSYEVYRTDALTIGKIGMHWALGAVSGGRHIHAQARSLLDTTPLSSMIRKRIEFKKIGKQIEENHLEAVAISATNYTTSDCISFYAGQEKQQPWSRSRRIGVKSEIGVKQVMASSAIPILFPPIQLGEHFFGDGCLRNTAPLSPALHLGAERLIVIGVRKGFSSETSVEDEIDVDRELKRVSPFSIATILNVLINAVMLDGIDADLERLSRINHTVSLLTNESKAATSLRSIDWLYIHPSRDIAEIALGEAQTMPAIIRYLMAGLGSQKDAADLISYLLFEPSYCSKLIELGYSDAMNQENSIKNFLRLSKH